MDKFIEFIVSGMMVLSLSGMLFLLCFALVMAGFAAFDLIFDVDLKEYIKKKKKTKAENKIKKNYEKTIKKYNKENDSTTMKVLEYDYANYVAIINELLNNVCNRKKYSTNNMYLVKFFEYISNNNIDTYSIEGIYFLFKSIAEFPIINIKNKETYEKNIEILKQLLFYNFPKKFLYYQKRKVSSCEVKRILIDLILVE